MKFLKNLFSKPEPEALIYQTGQDLGSIVTRFPVIRCSPAQVQAVISNEAQNRDHTPVILGSLRSVELLHETECRPVAEVLARAQKFDFDAWMDQARQEWATGSRADAVIPPRGDFVTGNEQPDAIALACWNPLTAAPMHVIHIGLLPTSDPTEVPAILDCGGWNAFPESEVHVGLLRRWRDRYGARLIGHTTDTLTFHVLRPPHTPQEALELATEHYAYCSDVIDQGFGSLDALAGALMHAPTWQFWWD